MKFDLARARKGHPVQVKLHGAKEWVDFHFVGIDCFGHVVLDNGHAESNGFYTRMPQDSDRLRMKPMFQYKLQQVLPSTMGGPRWHVSTVIDGMKTGVADFYEESRAQEYLAELKKKEDQ